MALSTVSFGIDVTELRRSERIKLEAEERFRSLVKYSQDIILPGCFRKIGWNAG